MPFEPQTVTVRPATRDDYPQWLTLWQGYNHFYGRSGPTALPEAVTHVTWERFFDVYEPMQCLVAEHNGKLAGLAHYLYHRSTLAIAPYCYLHDLFTDEALRGQGIGRKLIDAVYAQAANDGAARVYWLTHETNTTARKLYDQMAELSGFLVYRKNLP